MKGINSSIFRAYDIRGKYPTEFNISAAKKVAEVLSLAVFDKKGPIAVAHDTRKSSVAIYNGIIKGLGDRKLIKIGPATTPMFYFFVIKQKAKGGIMVTASHNPSNWNGLKIVGPRAAPISGFDVKKELEKNG
jgi:phosphomannomutase